MTRGIGPIGRAVLVACSLAATARVAESGDILYAVRGDRLFRIDVDTLTSVEVGDTNLGTIAGLAFGADGLLYGVVAASGTLVAIDPETAVGFAVGPLGVPVSMHSGLGRDPTTDLLYAVSSQGQGVASYLVTVSTANGLATPVADTQGEVLLGLAFDDTGQLWGLDGAASKDELVRIDKVTGELVPVIAGGLAPFKSTGALDISASGTFWTINSVGSSYELVEIDPASGFAQSRGLIQGLTGTGTLNGLASAPPVGLQVYPPSPGKAGKQNIIMVTGATPGARVTLAYGFHAGPKKVPQCPGAEFGIDTPFLLKTHFASAEGVVKFVLVVRPGLAGVPIKLQALDQGNCKTSNVLTVVL